MVVDASIQLKRSTYECVAWRGLRHLATGSVSTRRVIEHKLRNLTQFRIFRCAQSNGNAFSVCQTDYIHISSCAIVKPKHFAETYHFRRAHIQIALLLLYQVIFISATLHSDEHVCPGIVHDFRALSSSSF